MEGFFLFLKVIDLSFFTYLDLASVGPGPGAEGRRRVEMCRRVLKTLRKMVNIKVFYKKVYNHLNIYTNTQIYIHIYVYTSIIWLLKKVVITSVIIDNKPHRIDSNNKACGSCFPPRFFLFLRLFLFFFADSRH